MVVVVIRAIDAEQILPQARPYLYLRVTHPCCGAVLYHELCLRTRALPGRSKAPGVAASPPCMHGNPVDVRGAHDESICWRVA